VQTRAATGRKHATNHSAHVLRRSGHTEVAAQEWEGMVKLLVRAGLRAAKGQRPKAKGGSILWAAGAKTRSGAVGEK
jgi:hypothetical protein